jgi:hypothetical protein
MATAICPTPESVAKKFLTDHDLVSDGKMTELTTLITDCVASSLRCALGVDNDQLGLAEFLKELTASEPESKTSPGLQLSWLEERQQFYGGIHVFPLGTVASRTVVVKALAPDLTQCLIKLLIGYRESRK